jgi:hypothetical protein
MSTALFSDPSRKKIFYFFNTSVGFKTTPKLKKNIIKEIVKMQEKLP